MKDLNYLTNEQLDKEIEDHKTATQKIIEESAYSRDLNLEKLKRLTKELADSCL